MGTRVVTVNALRVAGAFLTRIPLGVGRLDDADLARSVVWFPVVGAVVGLVTAIVFAAAAFVLPKLIAALIAVAVATLLTGAFHEDGLADTADALGGSFTRERALEIFKDPRHGTYGVLALVLSIGLRVACIGASRPLSALVVLPAAHALSRAGAVQLLAVSRSAAPGLGASYGDVATRPRIVATAIVGLVIAAGCVRVDAAAFTLATVGGVGVIGWMSVRKIGGVTGDVLGAAQQVAELAILAVAVGLQ